MENNEISANQYKGTALEKSITLNVEMTLECNLQKGLIDQDLFDKSMIELDILKAGKRAVIGEIRERSGGRYKKTVNGWEKVTEGSKHEAGVDYGKMANTLVAKYKVEGADKKALEKHVEDFCINKKGSSLNSIISILGLKDSDKKVVSDLINRHEAKLEGESSKKEEPKEDLVKLKDRISFLRGTLNGASVREAADTRKELDPLIKKLKELEKKATSDFGFDEQRVKQSEKHFNRTNRGL